MLRRTHAQLLVTGGRYRPGMPRRRLPLPGPLDVPGTIGAMTSKAVGRPRHGPGAAVWTTITPLGPATLHVEVDGGELAGEAWGPGSEWVLDGLGSFVGFEDDPESFHPPSGLISELHRRNRGLRLGATRRVFEALVPAILGQRVTTVEAKRGYRALTRRFGERAPGPVDVWTPPRADALAAATYAELHPLGIERTRAQILIEVARRAARLEEAVAMDRAAAATRLSAVRGVGDWTVAIVAGAAFGDPDAVPIGDYHMPNTVSWALAGESRGDDARMLELLEPYRGHRRRVLLLLGRAGIHAPRYGPKTAPRDFTRS